MTRMPAGNNLDDTAVANIMRALAANGEAQLTKLDLSGNNLLAQVRRKKWLLRAWFVSVSAPAGLSQLRTTVVRN